MGRLVRPQQPPAAGQTGGLEGTLGGDADDGKKQGDTYLERVAKYIPAELIAFYIFVNPILKQSLPTPGTMAGFSVASISIIIFFGCWILTPVYLWRLGEAGDARLTNTVVATLLFPVWAYAVEGVGPTQFIPFDGDLASIVLGAASVLSGLVVPQTKEHAAKFGET